MERMDTLGPKPPKSPQPRPSQRRSGAGERFTALSCEGGTVSPPRHATAQKPRAFPGELGTGSRSGNATNQIAAVEFHGTIRRRRTDWRRSHSCSGPPALAGGGSSNSGGGKMSRPSYRRTIRHAPTLGPSYSQRRASVKRKGLRSRRGESHKTLRPSSLS